MRGVIKDVCMYIRPSAPCIQLVLAVCRPKFTSLEECGKLLALDNHFFRPSIARFILKIFALIHSVKL